MVSTDVGVTEKSRPIVGNAVLTTVMSMMLMNIAANTHRHLRRRPCAD